MQSMFVKGFDGRLSSEYLFLFSFFFWARWSLKGDKSHFEFRLLSKRLPHSLDGIIVGCLATMLQQMSEWMNEWLNGWSRVECSEFVAGGKWQWMYSDDNVFNSLQNVHLPCRVKLHLRHRHCHCHRQRHQRIPQALLRTPSSFSSCQHSFLYQTVTCSICSNAISNWLISQISAGEFLLFNLQCGVYTCTIWTSH